MRTIKVVEFIDINAPRAKVCDIIMNLERRLQLSPLWGAAIIENMSPDYPQAGSSYHVRLAKGDQPEYDTVITEYVPGHKFAYGLSVDRQTNVIWSFQDVSQGTRIIYEEEFLVDEAEGTEFSQSVRDVVKHWLSNIKRYAELNDGQLHRLVKFFLDRFYLRLRNDQRRVVQTILFMQAVGFISFVMAAIALGLAALI